MKAVGIMLVAMGYFCIVVLLLTIVGMFIKEPEPEMSDLSYAFGYYFGQILVLLLFSFITYLFIKHGKKFIKKAYEKRKITLDLEEIGK